MVKETWEEIKLLCVPIIWAGLSIYVCKLVVVPILWHYCWLICANFLATTIFCIFFFKVWWYKEKYVGHEINVREPHKGFSKMNYDVDPAEVGTNPFGAAFFWHFSAILITNESCIHLFMGSDLQRAAVNGDNTYCLGMMAQEMNHGIAQLFYSRGVEKSLGYPEGYRQIYKYLLLKLISSNLRAAFMTWIEACGLQIQLMVRYLPIKFENLAGEPAWVFSWHFVEEAEHSWDYSHEMKERIPTSDFFILWLVMVPICVYLWTQSILQGLWYALPTFWKHPSRIVTAPLFHITLFVQMLVFMISYSFLEMVLGMRVNNAYVDALDGMLEDYEPYKHFFKITHKQAPSDPHVLKRVLDGAVASQSSVQGVQEGRKILYRGVVRGMKYCGMTEDEIDRTSFSTVTKTDMHNPLLS